MEYINKDNEARANLIIDGYLDIARAESYDARHLYSQFGSFSAKNELVDNILSYQNKSNLCCYCYAFFARPYFCNDRAYHQAKYPALRLYVSAISDFV